MWTLMHYTDGYFCVLHLWGNNNNFAPRLKKIFQGMKTYNSIIIGSGLGGLTAGTLLALWGKKVLILEQHYIPGGCATTFKRKDFLMELKSGLLVHLLLLLFRLNEYFHLHGPS